MSWYHKLLSWRFTSLVIVVTVSVVLITPAHAAPFAPGDILVNEWFLGNIKQYAPDGTLKQTFSTGFSTTAWYGAEITAGGNLVTAYGAASSPFSGRGVHIFSPAGTLLNTFTIPQITNNPGDIGIFADGTLAVANQAGHSIELYSQAGAFQATLPLPDASTRRSGCTRISPIRCG